MKFYITENISLQEHKPAQTPYYGILSSIQLSFQQLVAKAIPDPIIMICYLNDLNIKEQKQINCLKLAFLLEIPHKYI